MDGKTAVRSAEEASEQQLHRASAEAPAATLRRKSMAAKKLFKVTPTVALNLGLTGGMLKVTPETVVVEVGIRD